MPGATCRRIRQDRLADINVMLCMLAQQSVRRTLDDDRQEAFVAPAFCIGSSKDRSRRWIETNSVNTFKVRRCPCTSELRTSILANGAESAFGVQVRSF